MKYFFELGSFKALSTAELNSVLEIFDISKDSLRSFSSKIVILDNNSVDEQTVLRIFNRLGGYIRCGAILDDLDTFLNEYNERKVVYGISYIGTKNFDLKKIVKLSNDLKKYFIDNGIKVRFLLPKRDELNAAQIVNNKVLEKGFELCILEGQNETIYGKTLAIQDVDSFAQRDVDRPNSDTEMGMLPPKLARIMCNLTSLKEGVIWDPFCGSGTIPMEASILGYNILASDIEESAIESTQKNIEWLSREGKIGDVLFESFQMDVLKPANGVLGKLKLTEIDGIVCEPFMGPPQTRVLTVEKAEMLLDNVKKLYKGIDEIVNRANKRGIRIVIVVPSYKTVNGWKTFPIREVFNKRWDILNKEYAKEDLKWERNNSIISRNIFILSRS